MKEMAQSIYWTQETVSVYFVVSKSKDDLKKPTTNIFQTPKNMIRCSQKLARKTWIVQYKSGLHFYHLQEIANVCDKTIIQMSWISNHGKGKVDHVGGTGKATVQQMAATGCVFHNAMDIVECLIEKYAESSTNYCIKEISEEELQLVRYKEELQKKSYNWMFQELNKVQNYVLLYLSLVSLCSEVPLGCVFVWNVGMIMHHVIFLMIILWVSVKYQCHICKLKMQLLKLKKIGNKFMMNAMITRIFLVLTPLWLLLQTVVPKIHFGGSE